MRFRIDIKIFLLLFLFFITKQLELYLIIMISVVLHECGHLIVGILLKMKPEKIEILPIGISVSFKINIDNYNKKIGNGNLLEIKKMIVAMAGPLTNVFILMIIGYFKFDFIKEMLIIYANILIIIFNMLPIYPLDGGRILKCILHIGVGKRKSEQFISKISIFLTVILSVVSSILLLYTHNIAIVIIMIYLWGIVLTEDMKYRRLERVYNLIEEKDVVVHSEKNIKNS